MDERPNIVKMSDKSVTLLGPELKIGDPAPDFALLDNGLKPVKLSDSKGKIRLFSVVPSLDTEVCALQTERFNQEAQKLGDDIVIYTVSMDLPFAQKRWVTENEVNDVTTLSDFNAADFGQKYGLLLKEIRLLTRAVVIVDRDDKIASIQIVPEISDEPNYGQVLDDLKQLV